MNLNKKATIGIIGAMQIEVEALCAAMENTECETVGNMTFVYGDLKGKKVIDVGCGAGFPGVPVKIACPQADLTLLDSLGKRMNWLESILPQLGVDATCVTARAEEAITTRREQYDIATSRAVARLNILLELTAPYVKVGGAVLAMKGAAAKEELAEAKTPFVVLA